jgi:N-acetylmuramic acid 6-phosphate etherase
MHASEDRGHLLTEQANPRSSELDTLSCADLVNLFISEDLKPQQAVAAASAAITDAVEQISQRLARGGRLFYVGAGTSGRLGVLDAAECPPTFCSSPELVQGVLVGGAAALLKSSEGLEDLRASGVEDLNARHFGPGDCLIGIAAGGTTPYVHGALDHAMNLGALAIAMACVPADQAPMPCTIDIRLLTGPELLTGSTRLKAGTATKMALNMISTAVMVRLGKVYGNRMVDVAATNSKLVDRSLRILRDLAGVPRDEAMVLLKEADGSVKVALLMAASGLSASDSIKVLQDHHNQLRDALESCGVSLKSA